MNRRELIKHSFLGAAAVTVSGAVGTAFANNASAENDSGPYADVITAAANCIKAGEACVAHCIAELSRGNTDMANCNKRVHEMLAFCKATLSLASLKSELLPDLAAVCAEACRLCKDACAEHRAHWGHGMHLECKACHDACVECERACRAV